MRKILCTLFVLHVLLAGPLWAASSPQSQAVTAADGALTTIGAKADTADTTSTDTNSLIAFTKGLVKVLADVWDSVNHRIKVDGSGVTQPISGTVTTTPPANASTNLSQINGVAPLMGNGVTGTGSPRVTLASDNSNAPGIGGSATGAAVPSAAQYAGGNGSGTLTGITVCDNWKNISITANTQIITGVAAKQTYICSIQIGPIGTATNVALVEGTGVVCATGIAGMAGGTTAATGWNFAANGGSNIGTGVGVISRTATAGDNVCLLVSAANQVSGVISWTQY